jgi:two-component system response regulator YesN
VLIVDDDKLARRGIISLMPWDKYNMTVAGEAQNGEQALEFLAETSVDILFVDIDMPVMDGISLMKKSRLMYPDLLYVVLTFYEDFHYVQSALRMGAIDYISKMQMESIDCDQLLEQISNKIKVMPDRNVRGTGFQEKDLKALNPANLLQASENNPRWQSVVSRWKEMFWVYDDNVFEELCSLTRECETSVRKVEHALLPLARQAEESVGMAERPIMEYCKLDDFFQWLRCFRDGLYCKAAEENNTDRIPICIMKAVLYVKEHMGEQLHVEDIAQMVNLSRSYFSTNFKKCTGISFKEFVRQERVSEAKRLLEGRNVLVADIAQKVGYEDVNYFIRVFYELAGTTPGEYKRRNCNSRKY